MIKNLLFDLGGVIMDIRRQNCVEAFKRLGMDDPDMFLGEYVQSGPFEGIENGSYTIDRFHAELRPYLHEGVTDEQIDDAFGEFLIGIPEHRLSALEQLHQTYRMYMLSNTNPIMWNNGIDRNFRRLGHDINYYFDGIAKSFEVRAMKPAPEIFQYVIDTFGIRPDETIFFDDSATNLHAASQFGFHVILATPGAEFATLLSDYLKKL